MPKVPYPYEVNGKLVTGNVSLIPICSLSNRSLLPSLTVLEVLVILEKLFFPGFLSYYLGGYFAANGNMVMKYLYLSTAADYLHFFPTLLE